MEEDVLDYSYLKMWDACAYAIVSNQTVRIELLGQVYDDIFWFPMKFLQ